MVDTAAREVASFLHLKSSCTNLENAEELLLVVEACAIRRDSRRKKAAVAHPVVPAIEPRRSSKPRSVLGFFLRGVVLGSSAKVV